MAQMMDFEGVKNIVRKGRKTVFVWGVKSLDCVIKCYKGFRENEQFAENCINLYLLLLSLINCSSLSRLKTPWEKGEKIDYKHFLFFHNVFESLYSRGCENQGFLRKRLKT